ncbi:DUF1707 domain-containing protein [Actinophytocola sp.]|uniref:DUF1707 domain-containing protein n=1 Tax=Actinophytocola sp. TaxID=1872138 RepID=UPI002ED61914
MIDRSSGAPAWLDQLSRPELAPVSEVERMLAARRIAQARDEGRIVVPQAEARLSRAAAARTRAQLTASVSGVPDVAVPPPLLVLSRVAIALWVVATVAQVIVWLMIGLFSGDLDEWWWIWTPIGGLPVAAALYWTFEWNHAAGSRVDLGKGASE